MDGKRWWCLFALILAVSPAFAGDGWWMRQADLEVASVSGRLSAQEIGGVRSPEGGASDHAGISGASVVPVLLSLAVPGGGQLYLGLRDGDRSDLLWGLGFLAADVYSWTRVASNGEDGRNMRDAYYKYADAHWSEDALRIAYDGGVGDVYFTSFASTSYDSIPLWVSKENDRREYYENLGKWDQFVFGWDDFTDPRSFPDSTWEPGDPILETWLDDPRTSVNRQTYRQMRRDSNEFFDKRDRWVYVNVGLRLVSALHVAYLEGLLGGGGNPNEFKIIAEPIGASGGVLGASLAF